MALARDPSLQAKTFFHGQHHIFGVEIQKFFTLHSCRSKAADHALDSFHDASQKKYLP